ncbi:MAG: peptidylprolyl isomerase [Halieaceae bacterium]|jgi:cyclophilin family peptidyl-prolyl cis-trans isomerase|tara:strand:- start:419 stop:1015 length:597 start_codon:yes stop_codon:yes gene_type:complete
MTYLNMLVKHLLSLSLIVLSSSALAENPIVKLETSEGDITVVLFADKSPKTVDNFLAHVDEGFYENTIFHRVIDNFMVQGGGFDVDLKQKKTERKVINESKNRVHNDRGTLAMARTNDPDSAGSQFFINQRNNPRLDWTPFKPGYTVFGEVITGMRIVDFIASTPTGNAVGQTDKGQMPLQNVPLDPIVLLRVKRVSP